MKRVEELFPPNLPTQNLKRDLLLENNTTSRQSGGSVVLGPRDRETGVYDVVSGTSFSVGEVSAIYKHWLSGGDFTIPFPGSEGVGVGEKGKTIVTGCTPPKDAKSFYRLFYSGDLPTENPSSIYSDARGGSPRDTQIGDHGVMSYDGYSYGILSGGPAFMQANPFCGMEFYDVDDTVKLSSYNMEHNSAHSEKNTKTNIVKKISNTHTRVTEVPTPDLTSTGNYLDFNMGSVGSLLDIFSHSGGETSSFLKVDKTGDLFAKTTSQILLRRGELPSIDEVENQFNPNTVFSDEEEEITPSSSNFSFSAKGKISQQPFFLSSADTKYTHKYKQGNTPLTPQNLSQSSLHFRGDNSVNIMGNHGSTIEFTEDGNIIISPKRNLLLNCGGDFVVLAGNEAHITAKNNIGVHSTTQSVQLTAEKLFQVFTQNDGILLETQKDITLSCKSGSLYQDTSNRYSKVENEDITTCDTSFTSSSTLLQKSDIFVNDSSEAGIKSGVFAVEAGDSVQINSGSFLWSGQRFFANASYAAGVVAATPVIINHRHDESRDFFSYARCGLGCYVKTITTRPVSIPNTNVSIEGLPDVSPPETPEFSLQEEKSEDLEFHTVPWQLNASNSFTNLTKQVKNKNVFPTSYKLFTFDGKQTTEIDWSNYKI